MRYEIISDETGTLYLVVNNEIKVISKYMSSILDAIEAFHTNNTDYLTNRAISLKGTKLAIDSADK